MTTYRYFHEPSNRCVGVIQVVPDGLVMEPRGTTIASPKPYRGVMSPELAVDLARTILETFGATPIGKPPSLGETMGKLADQRLAAHAEVDRMFEVMEGETRHAYAARDVHDMGAAARHLNRALDAEYEWCGECETLGMLAEQWGIELPESEADMAARDPSTCSWGRERDES